MISSFDELLLIVFALLEINTTFFIVYPILNGVYMSFTNASPLRPTTKLVGLENYRYLFQDDVYWQVLGNTIFIIGTATVIAMLVSLGLALTK